VRLPFGRERFTAEPAWTDLTAGLHFRRGRLAQAPAMRRDGS
jgi:hypothetical protein